MQDMSLSGLSGVGVSGSNSLASSRATLGASLASSKAGSKVGDSGKFGADLLELSDHSAVLKEDSKKVAYDPFRNIGSMNRRGGANAAGGKGVSGSGGGGGMNRRGGGVSTNDVLGGGSMNKGRGGGAKGGMVRNSAGQSGQQGRGNVDGGKGGAGRGGAGKPSAKPEVGGSRRGAVLGTSISPSPDGEVSFGSSIGSDSFSMESSFDEAGSFEMTDEFGIPVNNKKKGKRTAGMKTSN